MNGRQIAKVLCVDDEPLGLAVRKAVLEQAGYCVYAASSSDEALRLFAAENFDLVISDHLLPDTTGTRTAMLMKLAHPDVPILILSGLPDTPEGMEFADGFLCKGKPVPILLATVAKLLGRVSAASASAGN